jgi:2-C-methyl-D-erythritol 2,4-cyclodiphosphate synthase
MRIGIGYDIHRLIPTAERSQIPIGGVFIPCFFKVEAHSDGDVLLHALVDSCLGALALGDIGQWFPDSKSEHEKRESSDFVKIVLRHIQKMGWRVNQCDAVVFLEEPKLAPHWTAIRKIRDASSADQ